MSKFYSDLKDGLEEALKYRQGKVKLKSELIDVPKPPNKYRAKDIKKIREQKNYSQFFFAKVLNVSTRTVKSWESGQTNPQNAALRLIEIIEQGLYQPKK